MLKAALSKMASDLKILCVDDEPEMRLFYEIRLRDVFKKVFIAQDGFEALKLYHSMRPNIIICDLDMPQMNGFEFVGKIRTLDKNTPIVVVSGHTNQSYFIEAIVLGVNHYLVKPIDNSGVFYATIGIMAQKALELLSEERRREEELKKAKVSAGDSALLDALNVCPLPMLIVFGGGRQPVMNSLIASVFRDDALSLIQSGAPISDLIERDRQMIGENLFIERDNGIGEAIAVRTATGQKKIFIMRQNKVMISESLESATVYIFMDITRLQYERQRSLNLIEYMRWLLKRRKILWENLSARPHDADDREKEEALGAFDAKRSDRAYAEKISAAEYVSTLDDYAFDGVKDLDDLADKLVLSIANYKSSGDRIYLDEIAHFLNKYHLTIGSLAEFWDLAAALNRLCDALRALDCGKADFRRLGLLLESVQMDLESWCSTIFIVKNAHDIHYLDASLLSSCLQIESEYGGGEPIEGSDLELF